MLGQTNFAEEHQQKNGRTVQNSLPNLKYRWMPFLYINHYYCVLMFSLDKYGVLNTYGMGSENSSSHQSDCEILKTNHKSQPNNIVNLSTGIWEPRELAMSSHTVAPMEGRPSVCEAGRVFGRRKNSVRENTGTQSPLTQWSKAPIPARETSDRHHGGFNIKIHRKMMA